MKTPTERLKAVGINDTKYQRAKTYLLYYGLRRWRPKWSIGVIPVTSGLVLKHGRPELMSEAHTMDFVSKQTKIPVPKIITAFQTKSGHTFVLMTRIRGTQLYGTFDQASQTTQKSYLAQLRGYLEELRAIKPPEPPFVGSFDYGTLEDERAFYGRIGPFQSVQDFHSALVGNFDRAARDSEQLEREQGTTELWQSIRTIIKMQRSRPFAINLTHGDLAFRNIIVDGGRIVGILDWEMGGWLPDYWELACTDVAFFDSEDLRPRIREFLEPFEEELAMERLRRTIFANM